MSFDTYVNITRSNATIASNVKVQVDLMSPKLATDYQTNHPYDSFEVYIYSLPPSIQVLRSDLFIDTMNIDPNTNTNAVYRVTGRPEPFPDGHTECVVYAYTQGTNT